MGDGRYYLVHCGLDHTTVAECSAEATAITAVIDHEVTHACGTWWQRPLDGGVFHSVQLAHPPEAQA